MTTEEELQSWYQAFDATREAILRHRDNPIGLMLIKGELEDFYYCVEDRIALADSWDERQVLIDLQSKTNQAISVCESFVNEV